MIEATEYTDYIYVKLNYTPCNLYELLDVALQLNNNRTSEKVKKVLFKYPIPNAKYVNREISVETIKELM